MLLERILNLTMFAEDAGDAGAGGDAAGSEGEVAPAEGEANAEESSEEAKETSDTDKSEDSEGDDEKAKDEEGEVAAYTAEDFKLPEDMQIDEGMMDSFLAIANDKELSGKERDQALVDMYAQKIQDAKDGQVAAWDDVRKDWQTQSKEHKVYGGAKYDENKAVMMQGLSELGTPELIKMGETYGWMDHPDFQLYTYNVGKKFTEGKVTNGNPNKDGGSIEERWYPDAEKK